MTEKRDFSLYSIFIWAFAILFFLYEFFLRVLPATMAQNIMDSLDMSPEQFAMTGSAYYLTYSFMQIPVGLLLDRYSARVLITGAVGLCSAGLFWFSISHSFLPAFISRLLIGLGSSFGFVSLLIVTLNWFPKKYFAFLIGCGQFLGAMGPLVAGGPIALLLKALNGNWRLIFLWVAFGGTVLTLLIGIFFRGKPIRSELIVFVDRKASLGKRIRNLLSLSQVWWILIYAATIYVALPVLGAFWGTSYLQTRGFEKPAAALIISMIWVGLAVSSPLFGKISDLMHRRKPISVLCSLIGIVSSLLFLFTPSTNEYYLALLFFGIGIAGSGQGLSFAIMSEQVPSLKATALGLNNTAIMGFAALMPLVITSIISRYSENQEFTEIAFERGFVILPICFVISFLVAVFGIDETFCRQQNTVHHLETT